MCNVSQLDSNIRDDYFKNGIDLYSLYTIYIGEINIKIIGKWSESVHDADKSVGMYVRELCIIKKIV